MHRQSAPSDRWTNVLRWIWPGVVFLALAVTVSGYGFNPTDEGLIAAAAHRILDGQVPHLDFVSPRPAVSAYLHAPETLLPTPLFLTGRLIALAQLIAYSALLAWLILDRSPREWGVGAVLGVAASTLINLNTSPLMPWYTGDGLLFAALGLVLLRTGLRRDRMAVIAVAFAALALAGMTKQSFVPVIPIGFVWLVVSTPHRRRFGRVLVALGAAAVPVGAYAAFVALAGGWAPMVRQLTATEPVYGLELLAPLSSPASVVLLIAAPAALAWLRSRAVESASRSLSSADIVASVGITTIVLTVLLTSGLRFTAYWGILLTWLLAAYVVSRLVLTRRLDGPALILVLLAWMASLSYGVPVPNLVAGSVALALLHRTWRDAPALPSFRVWSPVSLVFALLLVATVPGFTIARIEFVHRDVPRAELNEELGAISPELEGIRTGERTATYLRLMRECVADHAARWIAVLPDNPAVYPAFDWHNPLPVDFLYPPEVEGARADVLTATADLAARGDYLVLFQRVRADSLPNPAIDLSGAGEIHTYDADLTDEMRTVLSITGEPVSCGPFDGFHAP